MARIKLKIGASILLAVLGAACVAKAECPSGLPLDGMVTVDNCDRAAGHCVPAGDALYQYMSARHDDDPALLVVGLHGSPWHVYGGDNRILGIDELAAMVRAQGKAIKKVVLLASWSGVRPDKTTKSIAEQLSAALQGMPVVGQDGFVWYASDGQVSTTRQAFTGIVSGPYFVKPGDKVMASMAAGWIVSLEPAFVKEKNAPGLMRTGMAYDVYMLCPDRALQAFEASAALSDPIGAYNAAIMHLERGGADGRKTAVALLERSARAGNGAAQAKLRQLGVRK